VPTEESDERLMARFQRGDARAFEVLVSRHRTPVFSFLLRLVGERTRAEDLLQEAFLRVVRAAPEWEARARFTTWLYGIARNLAIDESRRAAFRRTEPLEGAGPGCDPPAALLASGDPLPDRAAEAALLRPRLEAALASLPAEQREVFLLREQAGLPFREIASVTGTPENTVKSRMRYALEGLRAALASMGIVADEAGGRSTG
jgi:RNA polymerase sigma-70 factor (ECF subfamily)